MEMVGSYDPRVDRVQLNGERIKHWMAHGATVSDTVHNLLVSQKIIDAKKINVLPKKTPPKVSQPEPAAPKAPETPEEPVSEATPTPEKAVAPEGEQPVAAENAAE